MDDAAGSGESSDTSPLAVAPSPPSSNFEQQAVKPHSPAPVLSESSSSTTIFSSSYADVVAAAVTAPPDKAHPPSAEGTQEAPTKREMTRVEKRLHRFIELVTDIENMDLNRIREMAACGIPDEPGLRAKYWKMLLNVVPVPVRPLATSCPPPPPPDDPFRSPSTPTPPAPTVSPHPPSTPTRDSRSPAPPATSTAAAPTPATPTKPAHSSGDSSSGSSSNSALPAWLLAFGSGTDSSLSAMSPARPLPLMVPRTSPHGAATHGGGGAVPRTSPAPAPSPATPPAASQPQADAEPPVATNASLPISDDPLSEHEVRHAAEVPAPHGTEAVVPDATACACEAGPLGGAVGAATAAEPRSAPASECSLGVRSSTPVSQAAVPAEAHSGSLPAVAVATSQPSSPYEHASSSSNNNQATGAAITTSGNACTAENGAESIKRGDPFTTIWADYLAKQRALFRDFVKMFCVDPRESPDHPDDHPLSTDNNSTWRAFFDNQRIIEEIRKDIRRTCPDLHFFVAEDPDDPHALGRRHAALERILYVYAKLNPGICYVQGMNEILAPIYYVFAQEPGISEEDLEADAFWAFTTVMSETRDMFCKPLDQQATGLQGSIALLAELIRRIDPPLWQNMESKGIKPQFFGVRWLSLLLSQVCQEFCMPDVLRIWDALFADPRRFELLHYLCTAMVVHYRAEILRGDFSENIKLLQHLPPVDVNVLLREAVQLRERDQRHEFAPPAKYQVGKPIVQIGPTRQHSSRRRE